MKDCLKSLLAFKVHYENNVKLTPSVVPKRKAEKTVKMRRGRAEILQLKNEMQHSK